ncbi:hypothetical protein CHLNCDRAFT_144977 [Chlorella variabilis]|uniref:DUF155 domain-containing protein n=1 Tax=Chlorella variabilis TaxID=554065 RepID=E1ZDE9_CHLVA|nr:hypothetical protein CHLNCDRAFT_144977 [Chlorella variabilis]EFN56401.1 hypothetical protein CHLNCDRAFT_144977 [Chlorella variabilis]|eukprot:XP_005848503.1 hypothetical protein CHLNCDRAFT_144977 [Chlorella variabilis]
MHLRAQQQRQQQREGACPMTGRPGPSGSAAAAAVAVESVAGDAAAALEASSADRVLAGDSDWVQDDPSDCSMCDTGAALDEEAAAAAAALLGRHRAASRPLPPAASPSEQVFKADAHYVGSKIDIYALKERPEFAGHYRKVHKGAVVLSLTPRRISDQCETEGMPVGPYMVAFNYGSVVFFAAGPKLRAQYLAIAREVAADPVSSDRPYVEEYCLTLSPLLPVWSSCSPDNIKLQMLDLKNIQVISQVLAQSVAMDFYSSHVERTLETFCNMNLEMQETQNIGKINKQVLLQLVAENNIVMTDIINKLGVHERFDIAWKHVNYGKIWEFLRSELEMDGRFKTLESKLNLIQDNLKYFLEILQNRKSDTLEWIIIILIGAEICLSLYDLFSKGFN